MLYCIIRASDCTLKYTSHNAPLIFSPLFVLSNLNFTLDIGMLLCKRHLIHLRLLNTIWLVYVIHCKWSRHALSPASKKPASENSASVMVSWYTGPKGSASLQPAWNPVSVYVMHFNHIILTTSDQLMQPVMKIVWKWHFHFSILKCKA